MEVSVLESLTPCSQKRFPLLAETSNFRGFWFQAVAADLLSCVEICGFGVLSPATKLTTLAFSFVTLKGHGTTPKNQTCKDCWTTTPLCTAVGKRFASAHRFPPFPQLLPLLDIYVLDSLRMLS